MKEIDFIELGMSDNTSYHINKENILECDCMTKLLPIDCYQTDIADTVDIPIIESLLLVIDDYTKIISNDNESDFDANRKDIIKIEIYYNNGEIKMGYPMFKSDNNINEKQTNKLEDNRLYIVIEENFENF